MRPSHARFSGLAPLTNAATAQSTANTALSTASNALGVANGYTDTQVTAAHSRAEVGDAATLQAS